MRAVLFLAVILVAACESSTDVGDDSVLVRTDAQSYRAERTATELRIAMKVTYQNPLDDTLYVGHCGSLGTGLYKRTRAGWQLAAASGSLDCGRYTLAIPPHSTKTIDVLFDGCPAGSNCYPQFQTNEFDGEYRLEFEEVLLHFGDQALQRDIDRSMRVSNSFMMN